MPRTLLPTQDIADDAFADLTFTAFDNTNGMYIAAGRLRGTLLLEFKNTNAAARDVTILKGVGGDIGSSWRAGMGNLAVTVPLTVGDKRIAIRDFARFTQADGSINLDCTGSNVTVNACTVR